MNENKVVMNVRKSSTVCVPNMNAITLLHSASFFPYRRMRNKLSFAKAIKRRKKVTAIFFLWACQVARAPLAMQVELTITIVAVVVQEEI